MIKSECIDRPALVGRTVFREGVSGEAVIRAAQRNFEYSQRDSSTNADRIPAVGDLMDFPDAMIKAIRHGARVRRQAWAPNKYVWIRPESSDSMSYPEIVYVDGTGRRAPWHPHRCDMLENDWTAWCSKPLTKPPEHNHPPPRPLQAKAANGNR